MKLQKYRITRTGERVETFVEATCPGTALIRAGFLGYTWLHTTPKAVVGLDGITYRLDDAGLDGFYYKRDDSIARVQLQA